MIYVLIGITLLAAMSPGPDFIVVMKNALKWKIQGYMTALGVVSAILIHIAYCVAGIGIIISQSILLFQVIKIFGALYLLYLSYQLLKSKKDTWAKVVTAKAQEKNYFNAFKEGFITNVMNPKATLFFLSVFTQVISPETSIFLQSIYGVTMAVTAGIWFITLTTIINFSFIQKYISAIQYYLNKIMWAFLAILWVKILFSWK